jgi:hypothetical protein
MERLTTSVLAAAITFALTNNVAAQLSLSDAASAAMATMTKSPVATNMDAARPNDLRHSQTYSGTATDSGVAVTTPTDAKPSPLLNLPEKGQKAGGIDTTSSAKTRDSQTYSGTSALSPEETVATPMTNNSQKNCEQMPVAMRADANCITKVSTESSMTNDPAKNCEQMPIAMRAKAGCEVKAD